MKIFGFSVFTLAMLAMAFFIGTKMPNALNSVPIIGKL